MNITEPSTSSELRKWGLWELQAEGVLAVSPRPWRNHSFDNQRLIVTSCWEQPNKEQQNQDSTPSTVSTFFVSVQAMQKQHAMYMQRPILVKVPSCWSRRHHPYQCQRATLGPWRGQIWRAKADFSKIIEDVSPLSALWQIKSMRIHENSNLDTSHVGIYWQYLMIACDEPGLTKDAVQKVQPPSSDQFNSSNIASNIRSRSKFLHL